MVLEPPSSSSFFSASDLKPVEIDSDKFLEILTDPVLFSRAFLGLHLRPYQEQIIRDCVFGDRVAVRMSRQSGKSTVVAAFCLYWAFVNPGQSIIIMSKTFNQAKELFNKIRTFAKMSDYVYSKVTKDLSKEMEINGSRIIALPAGIEGKTARGYSASVLVLEECAYIPDDIIESVALPMLGSFKDGKVIAISTPVGKGWFYDRFEPASLYKKHHYSVYDCLNAGHFSSTFVDEMKHSLPKDKWLREYMAEFTEAEGTAFPWHMVSPCIDRSDPPYEVPEDFYLLPIDGPYYIGYDVGRFGNSAVFTVCRNYMGRMKLVFFKELVKVPYEEQFDYLRRLCAHFRPVRVTMDATGMGAPVAERFERDKHLMLYRLNKITFTSKSKHSMGVNFTKMLEEKRILLPNDQRLIDQIVDQKFRDQSGLRIYSCPSGTHDDILWSLVLCVYEQYVDLVTYAVVR